MPVKNQSLKQRIDGTASLLNAYVGLYEHYGEYTAAYNIFYFGGSGRENMRNLKNKKIIIYKKTTGKNSSGFDI